MALGEQGLSGPYRQVDLHNEPHSRDRPAVVEYQGQVWLIGGFKGKSQEYDDITIQVSHTMFPMPGPMYRATSVATGW